MELSKADNLNVKLLRREIESFLEGSKHKSHLFPLINLEGPQLEFSRLISWMKFETKEDYEKYFSRLNAFQAQASEFIALFEEGVRTGYVPPHLTVDQVPDQIVKVLNATFTDHNPLFAPLKKFPDALSENERESFRKRGVRLIEEIVKPSFKKIYDYYVNAWLLSILHLLPEDFPINRPTFLNQGSLFHAQTFQVEWHFIIRC